MRTGLKLHIACQFGRGFWARIGVCGEAPESLCLAAGQASAGDLALDPLGWIHGQKTDQELAPEEQLFSRWARDFAKDAMVNALTSRP